MNTETSFHDKWTRNPDLAFEETLREGSDIQRWILARNGYASLAQWRAALQGKRRILDAGCGNGRVTARLSSLSEAEIIGVDLVSADVARRNVPRAAIFTRDLRHDLTDLGTFDYIYCQEVLHHTGDAFEALRQLTRVLDGEIAFYVYKQKAPVREFVDDFVRRQIAKMPYDEALEVCRTLTALGQSLEGTVRVPDVPVLGIAAGEYPVQRFLYHFFCKCFYNADLGFEASAAINYEYYHPEDCTRHTLPEVLGWCEELGLEPIHTCVDEYGITVRATR